MVSLSLLIRLSLFSAKPPCKFIFAERNRYIIFLLFIDDVQSIKCRMRCKKYYITGPRKGSVDIFIENLPGLPDNIRYDGEGQYWIGFTTVMTNHYQNRISIFPSTYMHSNAVLQ